MTTIIKCAKCETQIALGDPDNFDGLCACGHDSFFDVTPNEKSPATAPTVNEGTKSIPERSVTTAYLSKWGDNTGHTYGTWSGEHIPHKGHIAVILDIDSVVQMMDEGPVLVQINPGCTAKNDEEVRRRNAEREAEKRRELRWRIASQIEEEEGFGEKLAALDQQATAIYDQIDKKVDAVLKNLEEKP